MCVLLTLPVIQKMSLQTPSAACVLKKQDYYFPVPVAYLLRHPVPGFGSSKLKSKSNLLVISFGSCLSVCVLVWLIHLRTGRAKDLKVMICSDFRFKGHSAVYFFFIALIVMTLWDFYICIWEDQQLFAKIRLVYNKQLGFSRNDISQTFNRK